MRWLLCALAVLGTAACSPSNPVTGSLTTAPVGLSIEQPADSAADSTSVPDNGDAGAVTSTAAPLCPTGMIESEDPTAGSGTPGDATIADDTAPPTTNPEPERGTDDLVLYGTFVQHDPCAAGERSSTIEVRYVLQGDVAVGDEIEVIIDDETYRDQALTTTQPGSASVLLFTLEIDGAGVRAKGVAEGSGGQLSIADLGLGVDRPGCSVAPHDEHALANAAMTDPEPSADPSTVVVAADVLLDFGSDARTLCSNGTEPSHSALVVVRETYRGEIEPGTIMVVTTYDTVLTLEESGRPTSPETAVILELTPGADLPGVGTAEWAAIGIDAIQSGSLDRQAAWKRALGDDDAADALQADGTNVDSDATDASCGADSSDGFSDWMSRGVRASADVIVLATVAANDPCATGSRSATIDVRWVARGDVAVGDQVTLTLDDETLLDDAMHAIESDPLTPFVFVINRNGDGMAASVVVQAWHTDLPFWGFSAARPGCGADQPAATTQPAADGPSAATVGQADAVITADVLVDLSTFSANPNAARCPNGAMQSHSALVSVRESLAGDLSPGTVLMVTTYDTLGWLLHTYHSDDPDAIVALTASEDLPGVGDVEWAAAGYDHIDRATPQRVKDWKNASAGDPSPAPSSDATIE